ncbi:MAG: hypothetical protein ACXITV_02570 [Luteibaculaceae bacterium]
MIKKSIFLAFLWLSFFETFATEPDFLNTKEIRQQFSKNGGNQAIGLRLGDPSGITYKNYFSNDRALEINVGRGHVFPGRRFYNNRFNSWNGINPNHVNVSFVGYQSVLPLAIQVNYHIHNPINRIGELDTRGLSWYYGFGAQLRVNTYRFIYRYQPEPGSPFFVNTSGTVTEFDLGASGILGLEYKLANAPISFFLDLNLFLEIVDDPFRLWLQNGIGARYHF